MNHPAEYLCQGSFSSKVIVRTNTHAHTHSPDCCTWTIKVIRKWMQWATDWIYLFVHSIQFRVVKYWLWISDSLDHCVRLHSTEMDHEWQIHLSLSLIMVVLNSKIHIKEKPKEKTRLITKSKTWKKPNRKNKSRKNNSNIIVYITSVL